MGRRPAAMQVAAICRDDTSGRVMLITSRGTGRWVIPKGWPMAGRTLAGAAAQEAWEEAGLCGRVDEVEIGRFTYDKVQDQGYAIPVQVRVFMMHVASVAETFPEVDQRERHWFTPTEAAGLVAEPGLSRILTSLKGPASVLAAE
ncbi:NUDIX hydrolase [Paracoccus sp. 1_MG-2023]|uniref:NUDIX hydrolase n=1 Tax=unclassified Paracoccus (in: a-proteobacteria) TaxID=2688777 RepID=UPI00209160A7|nr:MULTISPECIES: NUDIX hydrolase [unclassified Paracoccus (in: a-proteobacteria)]MDO6669918.1 NUDIX hydrolase [Paracoccus sp. 1_MG-2023]